jgi:hypothetical protein
VLAVGLQVVTKLFHIVEPDVACFGQKDYQQWRLITRMVGGQLAGETERCQHERVTRCQQELTLACVFQQVWFAVWAAKPASLHQTFGMHCCAGARP